MPKMNWSGYWQEGMLYFPGEMVVYRNTVFIASEETQKMPTLHGGYGWVPVGPHEPHKIDHPWIPEEAAYPMPNGDMSNVTLLCRECWKTRNYVLAFKADAHEYVIQEMP